MSQTFNLGGLGDNKLTKLIFSNGTANTCSVFLDNDGYLVFKQSANTITFPLGDLPADKRLAIENGRVVAGKLIGAVDNNLVVDGITENDLTSAVADALGVENLFSAKSEPQAGDGVYPGFANSMYFSGDNGNYLSRTASQNANASEDAYTISFWFKPSSTLRAQQKIYCYGRSGYEASFRWDDNGQTIEFACYTHNSGGYTAQYRPKGVIADTSSYYHFVGAIDRRTPFMTVYVNGVAPERDESNKVDPNSGTNLYTRSDSYIGRLGGIANGDGGQTGSNIHGYMANVQFIDGQALDASAFGQYLEVDGEETDIWIPKPLDSSISYGANGFYLDFSRNRLNGSGDIDMVHDVAPIDSTHTSANDWTAN